MNIRKNHVRQKLLEGQAAYGMMAFEFFTPGLLPILSQAGAEFVVLDMEHSGVGIDVIKAQLGAARGTSIVPIVRVPGTARHLISPVLDAGAMGIMVPLVETRAQAEDIVSWCRYRPEGTRGLGFSVAHDDYAGGSVVEKIKALNERTLIIALIESETGIQNADAILSVPGIDVGWLGHYDLTDSLGIPVQSGRQDPCRCLPPAWQGSRVFGLRLAASDCLAQKGVSMPWLWHRYRPPARQPCKRNVPTQSAGAKLKARPGAGFSEPQHQPAQ